MSSAITGDVAAFETLDRDECMDAWQKQSGRKPPRYVPVQAQRRIVAAL